ncbi:MAG: MOSC N-terminal beta barrel domain-containing protein [Acidimicrobiia bacterium]
MKVGELWRYPVKSMRGERLPNVEIALDGIVGDRLVHVENKRGVVTARTHPRLLRFNATFGNDGDTFVDGLPWRDPRVRERVREEVGGDIRLVSSDGSVRFDVLPLLVATDGAVAAFGRDSRRLRPNVLVAEVNGLVEREWEGRGMMIGSVAIYLHSLRRRCVMTTYDPDTLEKDGEVLRDIQRRFGGVLALNAVVLRPGLVHVGDPVRVLAHDETREILAAES